MSENIPTPVPFDEQEPRRANPEQLSLFVNLDGFEGPIDLLLSLAREQKVDLSRIAILPLAEQYLTYIDNVRRLDLEVAADYLVMAAWLAYLKSRLLLPDPEPEVAEEVVDMTDALKYQLLRLESMQQAAKRLMSRSRLGQQRFERGETEIFESVTEPVWTATLYDLLSCYSSIQSGVENRTLTIAGHGAWMSSTRSIASICAFFAASTISATICCPTPLPLSAASLPTTRFCGARAARASRR